VTTGMGGGRGKGSLRLDGDWRARGVGKKEERRYKGRARGHRESTSARGAGGPYPSIGRGECMEEPLLVVAGGGGGLRRPGKWRGTLAVGAAMLR